MPEVDLRSAVVGAWTTSNRVTVYLIEHLPEKLWAAPVPETRHRTVRSIAAHIHNSRRRWIRTLGEEHGFAVPKKVDERTASRREVISALGRSHRGMLRLLTLGADRGGEVPRTALYQWRNLPLDLGHVLAYFVAHEGHHRGQIVTLARQLGHRLPREVTDGLWQWTTRVSETPGEP